MLVIGYAKHVYSASYSIVICGVSACTIFFHMRIIKEMIFGKKMLLNIKLCFDFPYNSCLKDLSF